MTSLAATNSRSLLAMERLNIAGLSLGFDSASLGLQNLLLHDPWDKLDFCDFHDLFIYLFIFARGIIYHMLDTGLGCHLRVFVYEMISLLR